MIQTNNSKLKMKNHSLNPRNDLRTRSYQFSLDVILMVKSFPKGTLYSILSNQLLRAATSVGANIIEAKASSSKKDFAKFFQISLKSANETEYWLLLIKDSGLFPKKEVLQNLITEIQEISKMLGSSLLTLKGKRF